jgi:tetratricopeptide (TPR) repeat protein
MSILFKTHPKKNPMMRALVAGSFLLSAFASYSQQDSANYYLQKGLLEKQNGRRLESLKQFEKSLKYDGSSRTLLNELASAYMDLRKYDQAITTYKKLVEMGDASTAVYKQLLQLSFNYKNYDDVLLYAQKLKQANPSEKVSYYIGKMHYEKDNYGEAIESLDAAAKEDPGNAEVPYMVAHCYADMQNYKQAIPYFQKAIQLDATKPYWIYEMGLIYYAMNDNKNSLKYIKEAGDKGLNKDNDYMENLGIAYINAGELDNGVAILKDILKRKPSDINILNMVAEGYYDKAKYDDAIYYWDKILNYDKQNASALYMIGLSFQKKGEKEKGQLLCDKAIQMDPSLSSLKTEKKLPGM